jgi:phosphate transport system permease protein
MTLEGLRKPWPDGRADRALGGAAALVGVGIVVMVAFVAVHAAPIFQHNGLSFLLGNGDFQTEIARMNAATAHPTALDYKLRAWPLIYGTLLSSGLAVVFGLAIAVLSSIFIVELAPARVSRVVIRVVRLLASVPSVIYGLIGITVLVPFVGNHIVTTHEKESVQNVIQLTGAGLIVTVVLLTIMITPIMIALICEAMSSVPPSWREGAVALGLNPLRAVRAVTLKAIRPAIVAAAVLAAARAIGEAIMVSMVSGGKTFSPNPADGIVFIFEPLRSLASAIVDYREGLGSAPLAATIYSLALLLLFAAFVLSVGGYLVKLPLRKYQTRG